MTDPEQVGLADSLRDLNQHVGAPFQSNQGEDRVLPLCIWDGFDEGDRARQIIDLRNRVDVLGAA
jgi:hypothetical protein